MDGYYWVGSFPVSTGHSPKWSYFSLDSLGYFTRRLAIAMLPIAKFMKW